MNFNLLKKRLKNRYKRNQDETDIMEKLEDKYGVELTGYYGSPEKIDSLIKKLKRSI